MPQLTLLLLAALLRLAFPYEVQQTNRIEYYTVSGTTVEEIVADLKRLGPTGEEGRRFHGLTTWDLSWRYRNASDGKTCRVTEVTTYATITTTLPKWKPSGPADAALVSRWDRYVNALARHEDGHRRFGLEAAHEIDRRVSTMPSYLNCDLLEQAIRNTAEEIMARAKARSDRYDRQTRHGATQGAIFP